MDSQNAADHVLEVLPEFRSDYEASRQYDEPGDEVLIHVVMGSLARFYMQRGTTDRELAQRYWSVVEELATDGDESVRNAVHTSLIEWFGWGEPDEQAALLDAAPMQGPATKQIVAHYLLTE